MNAEDPNRNFQPSPGRINAYHPPGGNGVRIDSHVYAGYTVPPFYDSMIAKVIVHDETRPTAIARTLRALEELEVDGIPTTRELALDVLRSEGFVNGEYSTSYLAEMEDRLPSIAPA